MSAHLRLRIFKTILAFRANRNGSLTSHHKIALINAARELSIIPKFSVVAEVYITLTFPHQILYPKLRVTIRGKLASTLKADNHWKWWSASFRLLSQWREYASVVTEIVHCSISTKMNVVPARRAALITLKGDDASAITKVVVPYREWSRT
jgi:hypothetical protein